MPGDADRKVTILIVRQNCTMKPPPQTSLAGRHRRLCRVCVKAPLTTLTTTDQTEVPDGYANAERPDNPGSTDMDDLGCNSFTYPAFSRDACTCAEHPWICSPCGATLRSADTTYARGWTWRTRYSTYLGGIGTGIGEGNEGVECGRGARCLAARTVEKEIACDAEELAEMRRELLKIGVSEDDDHRMWVGTSYLMQEIEGLGGVMKKKVRKRVEVGMVVKEHEDEREHGNYLEREQKGKKDLEMAERKRAGILPALEQVSSSSSSAST
ncbi:hypothetical protein LTR50_001586 [Elasticomyces elasticus]|nr:hypothetical protein LTR50_001586 [Elasticomyces elasticus]